MPIYMQMNARHPRGYCDHARRLFPGLDTSRCVERSYISDKEPPLGERAVRALCSEPSIELAAKTASFGAARLYPALGPVSELAIKFGLREFCNYTLRYAHTNAVNP
jgi:hypothetical protein